VEGGKYAPRGGGHGGERRRRGSREAEEGEPSREGEGRVGSRGGEPNPRTHARTPGSVVEPAGRSASRCSKRRTGTGSGFWLAGCGGYYIGFWVDFLLVFF
jgi:hypothetical protein